MTSPVFGPQLMTEPGQRLRFDAVELQRIALPLLAPFRTSFGTQARRETLLVRVVGDDFEGWGECVALSDPFYSSEYVAGAEGLIRTHLAPQLLSAHGLAGPDVAVLYSKIRGHRMAKAAMEMAVLDAQLRVQGISLATYLGATRNEVECGVSIGITSSISELIDVVREFVRQGYVRIKLKIEPDWDVIPVRAVREEFGPELSLQVDANGAYTLADAPHLACLDEFGLILLEQPLPEDQIQAHAELSRTVKTPICLDESITSAQACASALALGACATVNIKAGRVGGYLEARRIHDVCAEHAVPVWCGGMLESGLGRAANVAFSALPNCTLPGDISGFDRFFAQDIVKDPLVCKGGRIAVPSGPGLGVEVDADALAAVTVAQSSVLRTRLDE